MIVTASEQVDEEAEGGRQGEKVLVGYFWDG